MTRLVCMDNLFFAKCMQLNPVYSVKVSVLWLQILSFEGFVVKVFNSDSIFRKHFLQIFQNFNRNYLCIGAQKQVLGAQKWFCAHVTWFPVWVTSFKHTLSLLVIQVK